MWVLITDDPPPSKVPTLLVAAGMRISGKAKPATRDDGIVELATAAIADIRYEVTGPIRGIRDFSAQLGGSFVTPAGAELVISVGDDSFHASVNDTTASAVRRLGERVTVTGRFSVMGDYEWDDEFEFEDTRADWQVTAVDGWMLNVHRTRG